ncbi:unnamed protein product [Spirodela intermedia]|uniref:Phosphoacetylglucosamine mutase n=1 Tax=Spirodela intermedia TaxID=51605 RepID=A0ABN7EA54_SPIIN|nr:unnamed protein product [Spirodela intermedia]
MEQQRAILIRCASGFPSLPSYGTAGVQGGGDDAGGRRIFRTGFLRSKVAEDGQRRPWPDDHRSHNAVGDNGVKVADPSGSMMTQLWEPFADALAGAPTAEDFVRRPSEILLGRDTRPSGEALLEAAKQHGAPDIPHLLRPFFAERRLGIAAVVGAVAIDMGILTTPQLHWMVRREERRPGASEDEYFRQLSDSFRRLMDLSPEGTLRNAYDPSVWVDGANGQGSRSMSETRQGRGGILNDGVGADFVQKEKAIPHGFSTSDAGEGRAHRLLPPSHLLEREKRECASLDGDADRLVYFRITGEEGRKIDLIDGDKILSLFSLFIKEQLAKLEEGGEPAGRARLGAVQTAYANGASTEFLRRMGMGGAFTPTGVKHLHEKASEYDVGIYFEANGHGTVLFSDKFLRELEALIAELRLIIQSQKAALRLWEVSQLINQAVGDALSGFLLVEAILRHKGWSIEEWNSLYQDLPSRQLKRRHTANAETQVVNPPGLQEAIDAETVPERWCFIRPSGTEDVVRVYAEAATQEAADGLARAVALEVGRSL